MFNLYHLQYKQHKSFQFIIESCAPSVSVSQECPQYEKLLLVIQHLMTYPWVTFLQFTTSAPVLFFTHTHTHTHTITDQNRMDHKNSRLKDDIMPVSIADHSMTLTVHKHNLPFLGNIWAKILMDNRNQKQQKQWKIITQSPVSD